MTGPGALERALINRYQGGFPLYGRPFDRVARSLGSDEATLMATVGRMLEDGWLSRFGPLYNADRMAGGLVLAAQAVPEADYERVAAQVNALPEVAHNYRRDHRLNMWFVLATETPAGIHDAIARIEADTGLPVYAFPKEREFYVGLWLELGANGSRSTRSIPEPPLVPGRPLDALDRRIIAATQAGLPLTPEPCETVAGELGCSASEVSSRLEAMLASGVVRRVGVVPNHYRLGLRGNGMTVWDIPDDRLEEAGARVGGMDFVSHCYARPRHLPDWPYNLFAMVHGRDRAQVDEKVGILAHALDGISRGHETLFSSAVLKKTGLRLSTRGIAD